MKAGTVDLTADLTTVSNKPALLKIIYCNTTINAGVTVIRDGTTARLRLKSDWAAGEIIDLGDGLDFTANLIVDPDNGIGAGEITLGYEDLR